MTGPRIPKRLSEEEKKLTRAQVREALAPRTDLANLKNLDEGIRPLFDKEGSLFSVKLNDKDVKIINRLVNLENFSQLNDQQKIKEVEEGIELLKKSHAKRIFELDVFLPKELESLENFIKRLHKVDHVVRVEAKDQKDAKQHRAPEDVEPGSPHAMGQAEHPSTTELNIIITKLIDDYKKYKGGDDKISARNALKLDEIKDGQKLARTSSKDPVKRIEYLETKLHSIHLVKDKSTLHSKYIPEALKEIYQLKLRYMSTEQFSAELGKICKQLNLRYETHKDEHISAANTALLAQFIKDINKTVEEKQPIEEKINKIRVALHTLYSLSPSKSTLSQFFIPELRFKIQSLQDEITQRKLLEPAQPMPMQVAVEEKKGRGQGPQYDPDIPVARPVPQAQQVVENKEKGKVHIPPYDPDAPVSRDNQFLIPRQDQPVKVGEGPDKVDNEAGNGPPSLSRSGSGH